MKKVMIMLAVSAPIYAGNEGSGGGGIAFKDPTVIFENIDYEFVPASTEDISTLIDAFDKKGTVFSYDLNDEVAPVAVGVDYRSVDALTSSGKTVRFIEEN